MNPVKYILIGAASTAMLFVTFAPLSPDQQVKKACMESNRVISGPKEDECGRLQDKYHMEFLCDERVAGAHCWVETK